MERKDVDTSASPNRERTDFLGECFVVSTGEEKVGQRYLIMKIKMLQKLKK
ncbi:MAG: hypothetical protein KHX31_08190 [Akkermansia sp.]|uniref:hypothetical protein n=1 Tax=Akkermansia sp. TaxID=1872421 RepID=UPI0025BECEFE|nr:hypothetical protein [Akkermansia sp.]MBS5508600.1 hypothetical protein [Akkermansia sp.]MCD8064817.1 hypothetical protein [Akkermansia sp.]